MHLDIGAYCSKEIRCTCGRTHFCNLGEVVVENGALRHLPRLMKNYHRILLVADQNTYAACGKQVQEILNGKIADTLIFTCEGYLVPDEQAVAEAEKHLDGIDFIVGVGSGVINDICKYVSFNHRMEYAIVATAPSMDGFASSGAAMIMGGMKITYTTHAPTYIIADVDVVKNAPLDMIRSGYGDIIGKYSSLNDWKLAALINQEHFCPEIYQLVLDVTNEIRRQVKQIVARDDEAIAFLTKALVLIGITLTLLGSTRPGSGSEHHLSHFFEIVGLIHDQPYFLHGTDVAYSTVVTAGMRERIVKLTAPVFTNVSREKRLSEYERIYAGFAKDVLAIQEEARSYEKDRKAQYALLWPEIVHILSECPTSEAIAQMFLDAGYDMTAFEKMYGTKKIHDAQLFGKDLKDRYSVLWLYYALFAGGEV
ncbi:MAG: sn-glycerol-1-phosphate dehydrogenase [Clostridia bacterium]|nr:sn-glycerol-1-phosphate dehydrogenase [Clostridia bacterium]